MKKRERRASAWWRWWHVSRGEISAETADWLAKIAKELLAANGIKNANDRRSKIVQTVGLLGTVDHDAEAIRQLVAAPESDFSDRIVGDGPDATVARKRRLLEMVRAVLGKPKLSDGATEDRIKRALGQK